MAWLPAWVARADLVLASLLGRLGARVAASPATFLLVPLLVTALLATGLQHFVFLADTMRLYVPTSSRGLDDMAMLQHLFPDNDSSFVLGAATRVPVEVTINLLPLAGSALAGQVWVEAARLAGAVEQVRVVSGGRELGWRDLCVKNGGRCLDNSFLRLAGGREEVANLTYPVHSRGSEYWVVAAHLGGVTLEGHTVVEARALKLAFVLSIGEEQEEARQLWMAGVESLVTRARLHHTKASIFWSGVIDKEIVNTVHMEGMEVLPITIATMVAYTTLNCMSTDWVVSKPLLGLAGLLTTCLAQAAGFGLAMYLGFPWQAINLVAVFLIMGIGMDSVFLLLASWARSAATSTDVVTRVAATYADAAVSLTITSLTNVLGFLVGAYMTGFPCVTIFCVYSALGLAANYLWMLTVFGAALAWAGRLEAANRHCLLFIRVVPKRLATSFLYMTLLSGGRSVDTKDTKEGRAREEKMMVFFRDFFSPFLSKASTKAAVVVVFLGYLGVAGLGISRLQEGLDLQALIPATSPTHGYFEVEGLHYRAHPYTLQLVVAETLDYTNSTVRAQVLGLIQQLQETAFVSSDPAFLQSWLHLFLAAAEENFLLLPTATPAQFLASLRTFIAALAGRHPAATDVLLQESGEVLASRFLLQTGRVADSHQEMTTMVRVRELVDAAPFHAIVYNPWFPVWEQYCLVLPATVETVFICMVVMAAVILVFIPNRGSVFWVIFTIISVEVGVLGFMAHLGIRLDVISMIVLVMGIGFSVDSSAHIAYHYLSAPRHLPPPARLAACLYAIGPPVVQGAVTTMIGVAPLLPSNTYIPSTFARVVFLVVLLSLVHSLFLLPALLTVLGPGTCPPPCPPALSPSSLCMSDTFEYTKRPRPPSLRRKVLSRPGSPRPRPRAPASPRRPLPAPRLPALQELTGISNPTFSLSPGDPATFSTFRPVARENVVMGRGRLVMVEATLEETTEEEEQHFYDFDDVDLKS